MDKADMSDELDARIAEALEPLPFHAGAIQIGQKMQRMQALIRDLAATGAFEITTKGSIMLIFPLLFSVAHAADLLISDPGCPAWGLSGSTVVCVSTPPPDPPPSGLQNCANQGFAVLPSAPISLTYGSSQQFFSKNYGQWGPQVWLFTVTIPAPTPPSSQAGRFTVSEYQAPAASRQIGISTLACDFNPATAIAVSLWGTTAEMYWGVGAPSPYWAAMAPGMTYYISVRNEVGCSNCAALMSIQPPQ